MTGGESWGMVRRNILKQTGCFLAEDGIVNPEGLGEELLRQLGLEEDDGLSAQPRHIGMKEKGYEEKRMRRGELR
jgi:hypothetical protein